ncbi:MAG: cbb3-type cytochrome oxidase assembly protein CcoS [Verrucomicrobia bacterium]|nr:cbb3-type cytochrome oxidase assembly protein CcoS [Verrucomicrobiota bacterium]
MSVIFVLIPASIILAAGFLAGFIWAVRSGQYEDTCTPSMRPLLDEIGLSNSNQDSTRVGEAFPPHPNPLPPGEGTRKAARVPTSASDSDELRRTTLPLPAGEGRGEGERRDRISVSKLGTR